MRIICFKGYRSLMIICFVNYEVRFCLSYKGKAREIGGGIWIFCKNIHFPSKGKEIAEIILVLF